MNHKQNKKKIEEMVFNRFDGMVKEATKIAEMFDKTGISFMAWKTIIKSAKAYPQKEGFPKSTRNFFSKYNSLLDSMEEAGINFAKNNDSTLVPVEFIQMTIDEVKPMFTKGANGN